MKRAFFNFIGRGRGQRRTHVAPAASVVEHAAMWNEPYLETCCRSALHRLYLSGKVGRPPGLKDGPCLDRLAAMGLARQRPDGRFAITADGTQRHARDVMGENATKLLKA